MLFICINYSRFYFISNLFLGLLELYLAAVGLGVFTKGLVISGVLFLLFLSLGTQAQGTACQHALPAQIEMQVWSPAGWTSLAAPHCASEDFTRTIVQALKQLQELPPLPALHGAWQSDILGSSPWDFFKNAVQTIQLDTDPLSLKCPNSSTTSGAVTLAFVSGIKPKTITLCPALQRLSPMEIMSNLLHEARHLPEPLTMENTSSFEAAHQHVFCDNGPLAHSFACDTNYNDGGSYAVNMEFLLKLSHSTDVDENLRSQARTSALSYALSHFNQLPQEKNQGLLLIDSKQSIYFYDMKTAELQLLTKAPASTSFSTLRSIPTFFNSQDGDVTSFNGGDFFSHTEGTMAEDFRHFHFEKRHALKDVYYGNTYACFLYEQRLECENSQQTISLTLPEKAVQFAPMAEPLNGTDLVHIVGASGALYMLPTARPLSEWCAGDLVETANFRNFLGVAILPQLKRYALTNEGRVVHMGPNLQAVENLEGFHFQKMIGPYYWSRSLQEL